MINGVERIVGQAPSEQLERFGSLFSERLVLVYVAAANFMPCGSPGILDVQS
jgi:hypothetical protein